MPGPKKILIIGGGFVGVTLAKDLLAESLPNTDITLVSTNPNFEYHAALYRVVTGRSPKQVSIPLKTILKNKKINIVIDRINALDFKKQTATGDSKTIYSYDYLVLAPGSQTAYYGIPGIRQNSFPLKSLHDAKILNLHLSDMAGTCRLDPKNSLHIVIVGGGATGVELAGELGGYMKKLVCRHHYSCSCLKIDLIECGSKVLSPFGSKVTNIATNRLKSLGVNILENTHITKENTHGLVTDKGKFTSKTIIWVAGIIGHALFKNATGLRLQPNGKVEVSPNLSLPNHSNVFVGGDNAATLDSGNALSALSHGHFIAGEIISSYYNYPSLAYKPILAPYSIPIGPHWAISKLGPLTLTGKFGWLVRRATDLWFFIRILSLGKAWWVFKKDK